MVRIGHWDAGVDDGVAAALSTCGSPHRRIAGRAELDGWLTARPRLGTSARRGTSSIQSVRIVPASPTCSSKAIAANRQAMADHSPSDNGGSRCRRWQRGPRWPGCGRAGTSSDWRTPPSPSRRSVPEPGRRRRQGWGRRPDGTSRGRSSLVLGEDGPGPLPGSSPPFRSPRGDASLGEDEVSWTRTLRRRRRRVDACGGAGGRRSGRPTRRRSSPRSGRRARPARTPRPSTPG